MDSMKSTSRESYHSGDGLERAIIDLVRVGSSGHGPGVRQLATRLIRSVPPTVEDPERFRRALHEALAANTPKSLLRYSAGELPVDDDGKHPLVSVESEPGGYGLVLPPATLSALEEIISERNHAAALSRAGIPLTRTVLLCGPPGVGKTMAARWIASRIGVPLVSLDLSAVISSFLGSSGRNIRTVLDYGKSGNCVLLLDEFDAVAKRRDDDTDIGELKRIVNVILVELDRWSDTSLLVAATNHPHLLDPAVGRRFDRLVEISMPGKVEREAILVNLAAGSDVDGNRVLRIIAEACEGMSGSDLERLWVTARRRAVLRGEATATELLGAIPWNGQRSGPARDQLWATLSNELHLSARQIAVGAGVSHVTVSKVLKRVKAES